MSHLLPSLLAMRAFEAAGRHQSVKKAAAELQVTPAAVSQQIKKLEAELELELFVRGSSQVSPTQAGRELQKAFEGAFDQMRRAVDMVTNPRSDSVTVGSSPSFSAKCILPALPTFMSAHPELNVSLTLERDFRKLLKAGFDISVIFIDKVPRGFEAQLLRDECLVPLASPDFIDRHSLESPRDLTDVRLLADDSMSAFPIEVPDWTQWFEAVGLEAEASSCAVAFESNASHAIDAAVAGQGVLLGRQTLAFHDVSAGRLVEVFEPALPMPCSYYLMAKPEKLRDAAVQRVWRWLSEELFRREEVRSQPPAVADVTAA